MSNNLLTTENQINTEEQKMTTQINSLNEQLFTELTHEKAAIIEGGALIQRGSFDAEGYDYSLPFKNKIGSKIGVRVISDDVGKSNPFNTKWSLWLQKYVGSGKYADVAYYVLPMEGSTYKEFSGLNNTSAYRLKFKDKEIDGKRVRGSYFVYD